jgi:Tfp pilus assembly protein PilF
MNLRSISKWIFVVVAGLVVVSGMQVTGQGVGANRANKVGGGGSFTVTGKVYMPDGSPAVGVRVSLAGEFIGPSTSTDLDGNFSFGGVSAGNYTVSTSVEGFPPQSESKVIYQDTPSGQNIYVPLFIRPASQKKGDFYSANPLFRDVPKAALEKFKAAMEKVEKKDSPGAMLLLDEAIALHPNFAAAYYQRGMVHFKDNNIQKALEAFVKAIEIKPDYTDAKYRFGVCQITQRNFPVAEMVFRDVITQKQDMPAAHMYLGVALIGVKKQDEAEKELKLALSLKGGENLALAHKYLGGIYMQKKQKAEAAAELQKYVDLSPTAPDAEKIKVTIAELKKG